MPIDRFALLIVAVILAAGLTVWVGALLRASSDWPSAALGGLALTAMIGALVVRVIWERLRNRKDDRYDRTEK